MLAFLVSCTLTVTPAGHLTYVGVYQLAGHEYVANFTSYCPISIPVR